jgi:hypothetical protein
VAAHCCSASAATVVVIPRLLLHRSRREPYRAGLAHVVPVDFIMVFEGRHICEGFVIDEPGVLPQLKLRVKLLQAEFLRDVALTLLLNGLKPTKYRTTSPRRTITPMATITRTFIGSSTPFINILCIIPAYKS